MTRRRLLIGVGIVIAVLILITVPVWLFQSDPPTVSEPQWDSPQTRVLAQRACFDCHSNQTTWPWYSRIPPGSWLTTWDVIRGRNHLNFSTYQPGQPIGEGGREGGRGGGNQIARQINSGEMPPWYYLILHPDAKLTDAEKQQLIQGLQASLK